MLNGHGDDRHNYSKEVIADFSSNILPGKQDSCLQNILKKEVHHLNHYPHPTAAPLTEALISRHNAQPNTILPTNGATEAFYLLAQLFSNQETAILTPTFAEYEDACKIFDHQLTFIEYSQLQEQVKPTHHTVWICNPNNPTGETRSPGQLTSMASKYPDTFFIIDEAYEDMVLENISVADQIANHPNLIVVKSLTKRHAIPALRLGYIVANKGIIHQLLKIKQPWSVNTMAIEAGKHICQMAQNNFELEKLHKETARFKGELLNIEGIEILPSACSFFLLKYKNTEAPKLKEELITQHGLLIRDASNFRGLDNRWVRIATQLPEQNNLLINAMQQQWKY